MSYLSISHLIAYVLILLWPLTSIHWGRKPERPACCHFLSLCVTRTELSSCLDICCWLSMSLCWVFYSLSRSLLTPVPHSTPTPCPAASPALVLPCWTLCHQKAGCLFLMWSRRARTALRLVFTLKMLFYSQNLGIKSDCAVGKQVQWISNVSVKLKSPASPETGISSTSDLNFFYQIWLKSCHSHGLSCGEANSRKTHVLMHAEKLTVLDLSVFLKNRCEFPKTV